MTLRVCRASSNEEFVEFEQPERVQIVTIVTDPLASILSYSHHQ
jgi:hypothetical protein